MTSLLLSWAFPPFMLSRLSKIQELRKAAGLHVPPLQPQVGWLHEPWAQCFPLKDMLCPYGHGLALLTCCVKISITCRSRQLAIGLAVLFYIDVQMAMGLMGHGSLLITFMNLSVRATLEPGNVCLASCPIRSVSLGCHRDFPSREQNIQKDNPGCLKICPRLCSHLAFHMK